MAGYTHQELRAIVIKEYGGRCKLCNARDSAHLNVVMVAGTEAQHREYQDLRKHSTNAPFLFLLNRFFPATHALVCTACARRHGGFRWIGKKFKHLVQWSPMRMTKPSVNKPSVYQRMRGES